MSDYPELPESGPEAPRLRSANELAEARVNQPQRREAEPLPPLVELPQEAPPTHQPQLTSRQRRVVAAKRRRSRRRSVIAVIGAIAVVTAAIVVLLSREAGPAGSSDSLAFGVEAQITVNQTSMTVWGVTVSGPRPVSSEADSHLRFDVVVRLVSSSSPNRVTMPQSPSGERWRLSWGGVPYPPGSWGPDGCLGDAGYEPLPADINLEVGEQVVGSLCLWPPLVGERWQFEPFVHLSMPGGDVVFTTDGLRADSVAFDHSNP